MRIDEFDYNLPLELIAQTPLANRESSRLLVLNKNSFIYFVNKNIKFLYLLSFFKQYIFKFYWNKYLFLL